MLLKTLFQEFVNFSSGRWNILLYNITVPVDKECEWNGMEVVFIDSSRRVTPERSICRRLLFCRAASKR